MTPSQRQAVRAELTLAHGLQWGRSPRGRPCVNASNAAGDGDGLFSVPLTDEGEPPCTFESRVINARIYRERLL